MLLVRIQTQLGWQATRDRISDRWVALCPALKVTAEAETWEKLAAVMAEEVNELLRDLLEEGQLDSFLREQGWQPFPGIPIPSAIPREGVSFDVPMDIRLGALVANAKAHAQA